MAAHMPRGNQSLNEQKYFKRMKLRRCSLSLMTTDVFLLFLFNKNENTRSVHKFLLMAGTKQNKETLQLSKSDDMNTV